MSPKPLRALIAVAATAAVLGTAVASDGATTERAPAPPTCSLSDRGILEIDPGPWILYIERSGDEIVVRYAQGKVLHCSPRIPTVHNVDLVRLLDDKALIDFRGGRFAPGLTDEGDGSSEIEFEVEHGIGGSLVFSLGAADDQVTAGDLGPERDGLNLNAGEPVPDVDVDVRPQRRGLGREEVHVELGGGDDRLSSGGAPFVGPAMNQLVVFGLGGNDELVTGSGPDLIVPGGGRDRVVAGPRSDFVSARRGGRDRIDCGPGDDVADADLGDPVRSCRRWQDLPGS